MIQSQKLCGWLVANQYTIPHGVLAYIKIVGLFLFAHNARCIILVFLHCHSDKVLVRFITRMILRQKYHIEISTKIIGERFMLPHPHNIIISAMSIGDDVQINQNVTIGGNMKKQRTLDDGCIQKIPIIKNNVVIYTNSVVGGPVIIGDNVIVGANCVCTHDVAANSLVYNNCKISRKEIIVLKGTYKLK